MRKVRICAPNIWVNSNENLGFAPPVFWPYVIDCAPNLQQVLPPLSSILYFLKYQKCRHDFQRKRYLVIFKVFKAQI